MGSIFRRKRRQKKRRVEKKEKIGNQRFER
jgi:hypothetical protein